MSISIFEAWICLVDEGKQRKRQAERFESFFASRVSNPNTPRPLEVEAPTSRLLASNENTPRSIVEKQVVSREQDVKAQGASSSESLSPRVNRNNSFNSSLISHWVSGSEMGVAEISSPPSSQKIAHTPGHAETTTGRIPGEGPDLPCRLPHKGEKHPTCDEHDAVLQQVGLGMVLTSSASPEGQTVTVVEVCWSPIEL